MRTIRRWSAPAVVCLLTAALTGQAAAEVLGRCGKGYLERIDGYLVLHVEGTPYEMGYQHGALLREKCLSLHRHLFDVKAHEVKLEVLGVELNVKHAIRVISALQRSFVPPRYLAEMRGLADAVGLEPGEIYIANSIPELFHCSGFALLGELTADGTLLHGRVLDYAIDWKLQDHAVLVVAKPKGHIPFVNVTYAGFIGSVTGMNAEQISIGEMGGRGAGKWAGTPMSFLMRRVLEEAHSLDEAISIFAEARRTCEYYYVVADAESNSAVGLDGSADRFEVIRAGEAHERLPTPVPHAVLMSSGDRYRNLCRLVEQTRKADEKFTAERAIRLMDAPVAMKSNLHNVLMAPGLGKLWVANATFDKRPAWTQKYHEFDFERLLNQPFPASGKLHPSARRAVRAASRAD